MSSPAQYSAPAATTLIEPTPHSGQRSSANTRTCGSASPGMVESGVRARMARLYIDRQSWPGQDRMSPHLRQYIGAEKSITACRSAARPRQAAAVRSIGFGRRVGPRHPPDSPMESRAVPDRRIMRPGFPHVNEKQKPPASLFPFAPLREILSPHPPIRSAVRSSYAIHCSSSSSRWESRPNFLPSRG